MNFICTSDLHFGREDLKGVCPSCHKRNKANTFGKEWCECQKNEDKNEVWECPHCGSSKGFWWSRSEPMGYICEGCGFDVNLKKKEL